MSNYLSLVCPSPAAYSDASSPAQPYVVPSLGLGNFVRTNLYDTHLPDAEPIFM